ncbi:hypothetical protein GCM10011594_02070 [Nakamurella endophytica]|uniref:LysM domain-containing protein n=2 Tax=Nakamurella endophytica TaxID=1748367 RepID=A0A917SKK5_9ACTN|nr:hypothetical protein GCM10011594_02070 [Nakamurella endophytica]
MRHGVARLGPPAVPVVLLAAAWCLPQPSDPALWLWTAGATGSVDRLAVLLAIVLVDVLLVWSCVVVGAQVLSRLPGRVGRLAGRAAAALTPRVLRGTLTGAVGCVLLGGVAGCSTADLFGTSTAPPTPSVGAASAVASAGAGGSSTAAAAAATPVADGAGTRAAISAPTAPAPGSATATAAPTTSTEIGGSAEAGLATSPGATSSRSGSGGSEATADRAGTASRPWTPGTARPATAQPHPVATPGGGARDTVTVAVPSLDWPMPGRPVVAGAGTGEVVVLRGDTLWAIAARHLPADAGDARIDAEWRRWYVANRDVVGPDPELILPGQRLRPPAADPQEQS